MAVSPNKKRLAVCAPRRKFTPISFCRFNHAVPTMLNLRGVCYELSVDGGTSTLFRTHDECKSQSKWMDGITETLKFGTTTGSCLRLKHSGDANTFGKITFELNNGKNRVVKIIYQNQGFTVSLEWGDFEPKIVSCPPGMFAVEFTQSPESADILIVSCTNQSGSDKSFDLLTKEISDKLTKVTLEGFVSHWEETYDDMTVFEFGNKLIAIKDQCMLGYSAWYDAPDVLTATAPGYNFNKDLDMPYGTVFTSGKPLEALTTQLDLLQMGQLYRSARIAGATWAAITATKLVDSTTITSTTAVIILKDGVRLETLEDAEQPLSGFGKSLLFHTVGGSPQLLVGAPFTKRDSQLDCGIVYVYTIQGSAITRSHNISGECGQFGSALSHIGDIDEDGIPDVAIGANNTVYIVMGEKEGLLKTIYQTLRPAGEATLFGYDVTGTGGYVVAADPASNKVHIYKTLPVLKFSTQLTCTSQMDIDAVDPNINCTVHLQLESRTGVEPTEPVNIAVSWSADHVNVTLLPGVAIPQTQLSRTVAFSRSRDSMINEFDLTNDINIKVSFSEVADKEQGRSYAVDPRTMEPNTASVISTGRCEKSFCVADFAANLTWYIDRNTPELGDTGEKLQNDMLYFGSGQEQVFMNISSSKLSGIWIDEAVHIDLGDDFTVNIPSVNCSERITVSQIIIPLSEEGNFCNSTCSGPTLFRCHHIITNENRREIQVRIPVPFNAYITKLPYTSISVSVIPKRNVDNNLLDNIEVLKIERRDVIDLENKGRLEPVDLQNIRVHNYKSDSQSLQGLGPQQKLVLQLLNKGSPTVERAKISILYPVSYRGVEVVYIYSIVSSSSSAVFFCDQTTRRLVNYRGLVDVYTNISSTEDKVGNVPTEPCRNSWQCARLECTVQGIKPGSSKTALSVVVTTHIDAEAAMVFRNMSLQMRYTTTLVGDGIVSVRGVSWEGQVTGYVDVVPGVASAMGYILGAVFGGTLLLLVVVLVLARCGFFKRNQRTELQRIKHAVLEADIPEIKGEKCET